jgi:hypothetical protein
VAGSKKAVSYRPEKNSSTALADSFPADGHSSLNFGISLDDGWPDVSLNRQ